MAMQTINLGAALNDGTGDTLRAGGQKINANFTELYAGTVPTPTPRTTSFTLALSDAGSVVEVDSASAATVTVPTDATVPFPINTVLEVCWIGAGTVTIVAASGVTINPTGPWAISGRYRSISLRKRAANQWIIGGDLA